MCQVADCKAINKPIPIQRDDPPGSKTGWVGVGLDPWPPLTSMWVRCRFTASGPGLGCLADFQFQRRINGGDWVNVVLIKEVAPGDWKEIQEISTVPGTYEHRVCVDYDDIINYTGTLTSVVPAIVATQKFVGSDAEDRGIIGEGEERVLDSEATDTAIESEAETGTKDAEAIERTDIESQAEERSPEAAGEDTTAVAGGEGRAVEATGEDRSLNAEFPELGKDGSGEDHTIDSKSEQGRLEEII